MFGDTERPARVRAEQDRALRAYVRRQVYPYSVLNRARLSAAGVGPYGISKASELDKMPPIAWSEVGDGADLVLRPEKLTVTQLGSTALAIRVAFASVTRRRTALNRDIIEPIYRPIRWLIQAGVPVGVTANDLDRLSEIGRRWLEAAGVKSSDLVVSVIPSGPNLDYVQLDMATRRSGVAAVFLATAPSVRELAHLRPTVLAGRPKDLIALLTGPAVRELGSVRTVLTTGDVVDEGTRAKIVRLLGRDASVVAAWSPPGVRAMWAECRGGTGFHTWPAAEIVEVVHPNSLAPVAPGEAGEVVWSALGWAGTVVLRLRTGVRARLDEATCPSCKRTSPR